MVADVRLLPALSVDAYELAAKLRKVEADEVRASSGREPLDVILQAINESQEAWAVYFDNELACVWGVMAHTDTALTGQVGIGWMLTTGVVERKPKTFWVTCLQIFPGLLSRWDELINAIDCRHVQALRWATRLGFRLDEPAPFGAAGLPFRAFAVAKEDLCVSR